MNTKETGNSPMDARPAHRISLPNFITDKEIGLGDVIKQATSAVGIKPCAACERRAAALNRWLTFSGKSKEGNVSLQAIDTCPTCASQEAHSVDDSNLGTYAYVLGKIEMTIPTLGLEKEIAQAIGRSETTGLTDRQALHSVFSQRVNRYLVRQLCWTVTVDGLATYILQPRDATDYDMLVETIRPTPGPGDMDVIVGLRGPVAPSRRCNGLTLPIMLFSQIYSFSREALIRAIPRPETISEEQFQPAAEELLDRVLRMTDNTGSTDEDRALNYLIVRYPAIYVAAADSFGNNLSLNTITTRPSPLSGARNIIEVIFSYSGRTVSPFGEKYFVRVDVTEEFPFLVSKLSPYYDR